MATYGTYNTPGPFKITFYGIGIVFAFLIMLQLTRGLYRDNNKPMNAARAAERARKRHDLAATNATLLMTPGWVNSNKAIVRLPIARAMQLTIDGYQQNAEAARSNLLARSDKAAAIAPAQPSQFE